MKVFFTMNHPAILTTVLVLAFAGIAYLIYLLAFSKYGPNSRCKNKKTFRFRDGTWARIVLPDENMTRSMVVSYVEIKGDRIGDLSDLKRLRDECSHSIPAHSRILALNYNWSMWALDTGKSSEPLSTRFRISWVNEFDPDRKTFFLVLPTVSP